MLGYFFLFINLEIDAQFARAFQKSSTAEDDYRAWPQSKKSQVLHREG